MATLQELNPPSRILTYLNDNNNQRVIEWVIDELEQEKLTNWDSIVDLGTDDVQDLDSPDLVAQKVYYITSPSIGGDVDLHLDTGILSSGTCQMIGSDDFVPILTQNDFNYNDLRILRNGVYQLKNQDVYWISENVIRITQKLDAEDYIAVAKQVGM